MTKSSVRVDWLILTACQPIQGYFMSTSKEIVFIVCSNLHFLSSCFIGVVFFLLLLNMVLSIINDFHRDLFDQ